MESYKKLLLANKAWAKDRLIHDPHYFEELAKVQKPEFLWVGCSDSRVPAEEVTGTHPGELFVHRNVANLVVPSDVNFYSVLQYAVENLKVKHVIVCGHYGCGGVTAALMNTSFGTVDRWLYSIKEKYQMNLESLESLTPHQRLDRMIEINVMEQVKTLSRMAVIQNAWKERQAPALHGWVFGLHDGIIRSLVDLGPKSHVDGIFQFES